MLLWDARFKGDALFNHGQMVVSIIITESEEENGDSCALICYCTMIQKQYVIVMTSQVNADSEKFNPPCRGGFGKCSTYPFDG